MNTESGQGWGSRGGGAWGEAGAPTPSQPLSWGLLPSGDLALCWARVRPQTNHKASLNETENFNE